MKLSENNHNPKNIKGFFQAAKMLLVLNWFSLVLGLFTILYLVNKDILTGYDFVLYVVSFIVAEISIFKILKDAIKYFSLQKNLIVHHCSDEELNEIYDEAITKSKYKCIRKQNNRLIYRDEDNQFLRQEVSTLKYKIKWGNPYFIPDDIAYNAYCYLNEYFKKNKHFYNERKLRMNSGIEEVNHKESDKTISLSKTNYYNSICTNEITSQVLRSRYQSDYCFKGYSLTISDLGQIFPLSESLCSNHIGVSTLAISNDNYAILTIQGKYNLVDSNKIIVSASGSLDFKDHKGCNSFADLIIKGMERELREECNLKHSKFVTKIVGYGRLLDRGGKPEFFGITKINEDFKTILNQAINCKEMKEGYINNYFVVKISKSDFEKSVREKLREIDNRINYDESVTVQLDYYNKVLWPACCETIESLVNF